MWSWGRIHIHRDSTIRRLLGGAGLRSRCGRARIPTSDGRPHLIYSAPEDTKRDLVAKEALTSGHCGAATTTFRSLQRIGQVETGSDMGGGRRIRCDAAQRRHSRLAGPALASLGLYPWEGSARARLGQWHETPIVDVWIPDPRPS